MIYKLEVPLILPSINGNEKIEEINIDIDTLNLIDIVEIESLYYKDATNINIPDLSKKMSVRWFSKLIQVLLRKQYPHLGIKDEDVDKINWVDAHRIILYLEGSYISLLGEIVEAQCEQLILAKEYKNDDDIISEKTDKV